MKINWDKVLTIAGIVGIAAVGVTSAIAQHKVEKELDEMDLCEGIKADRKVIYKTYAKHYSVPSIIFLVSSGCILGSKSLSDKAYKQLLTAYSGVGAGFAAYRRAVIDKFGPEMDEKLCEEAVSVMFRDNFVATDLIGAPDEVMTFYEPVSGTYFEARERDVILAEYHLNRNFALKSSVNVSELMLFLGLEPTHKTDIYGWSMEYGYNWVDISHNLVQNRRNGTQICEICYTFEPEIEFEDYYREDLDYDMVQDYSESA